MTVYNFTNNFELDQDSAGLGNYIIQNITNHPIDEDTGASDLGPMLTIVPIPPAEIQITPAIDFSAEEVSTEVPALIAAYIASLE